MKHLKKVVAGVVVFFAVFGLTAFGNGMMKDHFKDQDKIPAWAEEGVDEMYEGGVIEGFSEGEGKNFKGDEAVTRAQLAVMMHRYDKKMMSRSFLMFIHSLNKLGYIEVTDDYSAAAIMAEAGLMKVKKKPKFEKDEVSGMEGGEELDSDSLPEGYTYANETTQTFYLHFVGDRFVGQDDVAVDQWYGPFAYGMLDVDMW